MRRLDADLAAGRITHDQHRRQRDEILAEASGIPLMSPVPSPRRRSADKTGQPRWEAANPAHQQPPPPPAGPPPAPPGHPAPSPPSPPSPGPAPQTPQAGPEPVTRKLDPTALLASDRQTTAPSPADERPTDSMPYPDRTSARPAELTMPITRVGARPEPFAGPPPPGAPHREPPANRGAARTWLLIALAVLVALAAVIGGAWWLGRGGSDPGGGQAVQDTTARTAEPALEDRLPRLPGKPNPNSSTMSVDKGLELGLYSAEDAEAMRRGGAREVVYRSSSDGAHLTDGYTVIALPTPSAAQAEALAGELNRSITARGFTRVPLDGEQGLVALNRTDSTGRVSVVWYASGDTTVGIGVSQAADGDENQLRERLVRTIDSVSAVLPQD
ncbi:hypothetical protein BAY60_05400 [Prauserella muralis]|uniref:Uncharacterized protein n=1 Tax=Prauserella muralis TaxID=588067 RepID=A0A2V4B9P7_9PSEU|nr:hypothetical protein BAY60_05400 [Prauserella muralis]